MLLNWHERRHLIFRSKVESLKLALFILNLYAIYDLIMVSFKISDTTGILEIKEDAPISNSTK